MLNALVPGNRWDLLPAPPATPPRVGVVVCHYEQPAQLARTVAALHRQTLPPCEIVVADDGSAVPPRVGDLPGPVRVLTQPDRGFRAAAARNRGAAAVDGDVLVFLDADTVPEPGFLAELVAHVAVCPDVLAVGRRRHADLGGLAPGDDPSTAPRLDEPAWLAEAYRDSRDLLDADGRSFRFVISALLACRRTLFEQLDGFDERFVGYGGEDWDLGYRAWNAGAVLVHERGAVGWHDGPDWAGRAGGRKDLEAVRLAALVPEPSTRGAPLPGRIPDVLAEIGPDADTVRTVHTLLGQTHRDLRVLLPDPVQEIRGLYDGTVQETPWSADQRRRARVRLTAHLPLPPTAVATMVARLVDDDLARVDARTGDGTLAATAVSTRALGRAARHPGREDEVHAGFGTARLTVECPHAHDDLAGFFAAQAADRRREHAAPVTVIPHPAPGRIPRP